jgi:hypothetical protein
MKHLHGCAAIDDDCLFKVSFKHVAQARGSQYDMRRASASARNRLRLQEDFYDEMAAAQRRLVAMGRRPEMMAAFHSVPRDEWLETTIADISAHMGLPSSPQLREFTTWFLFLAHLQNRLVGVRDNSKVLNYFCMLLTRERFRRPTKLTVLIMELRYLCTTYFIRDEEYNF